MTSAVDTYNLSKIYPKTYNCAIESVSLTIDRNQVFAILGENGAGKTTFLRIMATQLAPTSGSVYVLGKDAVREADEVRRHLSVMPQEGRAINTLTPWDHVFFTLLARGYPHSDAKTRSAEVLERLELTQYCKMQCHKLSGGLKRRVLLAMCLSVDADIYCLDEPTVGLDPLARDRILGFISRLAKAGKTVIFTTHYVEEAEKISRSAAIFVKGRCMQQGTVAEMLRSVRERRRVDIYGVELSQADLEGLSQYGRILKLPDSVRIYCEEDRVKELTDYTTVRRLDVRIRPVSLEDISILTSRGDET